MELAIDIPAVHWSAHYFKDKKVYKNISYLQYSSNLAKHSIFFGLGKYKFKIPVVIVANSTWDHFQESDPPELITPQKRPKFALGLCF
jgi:hypothetical protein